ncbi:MAG: hypothetical protein L6Q99_02485 [Planctomycetes bacterium]|nr:hypothetical protein [Planctomycetota bacterium]
MEFARFVCVSRVAFVLAAAMSFSGAALAQDGKLDAVREAVRDGADDDDDDGHHAAWDDDDGHGFIGEFLGELIELACHVPVALPRSLLGDDGRASARFRASPGDGGSGYWMSVGTEGADARWSFRPRFELGTDFDAIERLGLSLVAEHASRFGFDATWSRFDEELANGDTDELELGDANFVYRFAQSPRSAWRAGLGVNWLDDAESTDLGVNFTYAADFLPSEHTTLAIETDFGSLGDAGLAHARISAGYVLGPVELCASWDGWRIGGADLSSFALGLRGWL